MNYKRIALVVGTATLLALGTSACTNDRGWKGILPQREEERCPVCYGSGKCTVCNGKRKVETVDYRMDRETYDCPNCTYGRCPACGGRGKRMKSTH